jgi:hypothetical protein
MSGNDERIDFFLLPICPKCGKHPKYYTIGLNNRPLLWLYGDKKLVPFQERKRIHFNSRISSSKDVNKMTYLYCGSCERKILLDKNFEELKTKVFSLFTMLYDIGEYRVG